MMVCCLCFEDYSHKNLKTSDCYYKGNNGIYLIEKYLHVKVNHDSTICNICWKHLESFCIFYLKVQEAQELFRSRQSNNNVSENQISLQTEHNYNFLDNENFKTESSNNNKELAVTKEENKILEENLTVSEMSYMDIDIDDQQNFDEKVSPYLNLSCHFCSTELLNFDQILRHYVKIHKKSGHVKCCNLKFYSRLQFEDHIDSIHLNSNRLKCKMCLQTFPSTISLSRHMTSQHQLIKQNLYECKLCPNLLFETSYILEKHNFENHLLEKKSLQCNICKNNYVDEQKLRIHISRIHNAEPVICDICGKVFQSLQGFKKHKDAHEGIKKPRKKCEICGNMVKDLNYHIKMVHPPEGTIIECSLCKKIVKSYKALQKHEQYHHVPNKVFKFKCNICDKRFRESQLLMEHIATHTGQPLYYCLYCSANFKFKSSYHKHKKQHHPKECIKEKNLKNQE